MNGQFDAYAAGLIDGEGCLSLSKSLTPSIAVGMTKTAKPMLERMAKEYGGTIRLHRKATEKWAEAWTWQTNGRDCIALVERIAPYCQIKAEQCRLLLRFNEIRDENLPTPDSVNVRWTERGRQRANLIRERILELNAKGPDQETYMEGCLAHLAAGTWVKPQRSLFDDLGWEPFSGPLPTSGMTQNGALFELPTLEHPTSAPDGSALLTTPTAWLGRRPSHSEIGTHNSGSGTGQEFVRDIALLPTPTGPGGSNKSASDGAVRRPSLTQITKLLPTSGNTPPPCDGGNNSPDQPHLPQ